MESISCLPREADFENLIFESKIENYTYLFGDARVNT